MDKKFELDGMQNYLRILNHDLRSPLNVLIGVSDLLLAEQHSQEDAQGLVLLINHSGKKMLAMIENYLLLEKIESGQTKLKKHSVSVLNLVTEIKNSFFNLKGRKELSVLINQKDLDYADPNLLHKKIAINESLFSSVFSNLLQNAVEASSNKSVVVNTYQEDFLCISFSNQGKISEEIQKKLFQKFSTSKKTGTGLGLYSAKLIIEAHGGQLIYEPLPEGTRFIIKIPLI